MILQNPQTGEQYEVEDELIDNAGPEDDDEGDDDDDEGGSDVAISDLDPEQLSEDDWNTLMEPVIVEAMLDGRLPCPAKEFEDALAAGFELGIVVKTDNGLCLARDIDVLNGLALAQEQGSGLELGGVGATFNVARKAVKRGAAKFIGRARTYGRAGAAAAHSAGSEAMNKTIGTVRMARTNINHAIAAGALGGLGVGAAGGYAAGRMSRRSSALVDDAKSRNKK